MAYPFNLYLVQTISYLFKIIAFTAKNYQKNNFPSI